MVETWIFKIPAIRAYQAGSDCIFCLFFYEIQGKAEQFSGHSGITYIAWNSACTGIITAASVSNYHDYVHFLCVDFCRRSEL